VDCCCVAGRVAIRGFHTSLIAYPMIRISKIAADRRRRAILRLLLGLVTCGKGGRGLGAGGLLLYRSFRLGILSIYSLKAFTYFLENS